MEQRVHIVFPSALFGYFGFLRNETELLCLCITVHLKKHARDASSEHDTIRQTTWHNSSSPDAVFCRNRPPKTPAETIPKPCVPLSHWQNLHHCSSAIAFSISLLPPFYCVMDAGADAGVEGVVFAARRARERSSLSNSPDFWPTAVSLTSSADDSASNIGHFWPNWTSSSLSLCVRTDLDAPCTPCFRMCCSVKRPSFHRHQEK